MTATSSKIASSQDGGMSTESPIDEGNRLQALLYALQECVRSALASIRSHRMRSFLTMLGVIIGVASVICIVSLLQGLTRSVMNEFQGFGGEHCRSARKPRAKTG